jgi:glyoxylate/hydroxypyruvate reductase A
MSILIVCNNKDPDPWTKAIKQKLPDTEIQIFPKVSNTENIDFALCWKPGNNVLQSFKSIKAVQSLGASVEHIFDTNSINPDVQVSRIVDPQLSQDMFEFLLALTMNHLRDLDQYTNSKAQKQWEQLPYGNIDSTCISILGAGKIGGHVAAEFAKMGFKLFIA